MSLQNEIEIRSKEIFTENYGMSIGEIIGLYNEGDIDIHPEFQRFYRWTLQQKSKLIESILLNIPIPPIFVSQRKDGVWDLVDGLQRLSTILQFTGILKGEDNELKAPLELEETKLLPSLKGKKFGAIGDDSEDTFTDAQRRYFKRSKLNVIIIQKESDVSSKYELFQRLNTGGTALEPQEVRNCLLVMTDKEIFNKIKELTNYKPFFESIQLSDKNLEEQYDMELVVRFIVLRHSDTEELKKIKDLSEYLDDKIVEIATDSKFNWNTEIDDFKKTFDVINNSVGDNSFRRYDLEKKKFVGGFLVSAYEIIALGIGYNPEKYIKNDIDIEKLIIKGWNEVNEQNIKWAGLNPAGRLPKTINLGRKIFQE
jgi:hypothetical protein